MVTTDVDPTEPADGDRLGVCPTHDVDVYLRDDKAVCSASPTCDAGWIAPLMVHDWFGLTYANYLVIPRTILQSAPRSWQIELVELLQELDRMAADLPAPVSYTVKACGPSGRFIADPIPPYDRGRTRVPLKVDDLDEDGT